MFDKQQRKIKRSAKLISVLSKYGFQDILARIGGEKTPENENDETISSKPVYERIRLAIEELGPTFVKLGQSFSNREDLLPKELTTELQKLQDNVEALDLNIHEILENEMNISVDDYFESINEKPLAAASIAQVYSGVLKDGSPVILKVKRPNAQKQIEDDLLLIKDLENLISKYSDIGSRLNLKMAISAFEKSLLEELSLTNERNNIQQFAINFKNNRDTYVPKVYDELSNNNVLCMEFVDGIKVTDAETLIENGIDPVRISEVGLRLFVTQILDYGFFHADPHAGNILIKKDGKVVFIDFGAVGTIQPNDKDILENLILNFVAKNPSKIVRYLKKMSVKYEIPDEKKFENDVQGILNYVHSTSLQEIDVPSLINKMRDILSVNRLFMPEYFYLLFKGISLIEGVGRSINPDLDVVKSLKPFTKNILLRKVNPRKVWQSGTEKLINLSDNIEEIPKEIRSVLQKLDENKFTVTSEIKNIEKTNSLIKSSITNLILAMILCANIISTAILMASDYGPKIGEFSIFPIICLIFSMILSLIIVMRILRK